MSLKKLSESLSRGERLLPAIRKFLLQEHQRSESGEITRKSVTVADAKMTIKCFEERIEEFNHGEDEFEGKLFHPSKVGSCPRALWLHHFNAPKNTSHGTDANDLFKTHMIFETGTYVGVFFANLCERAGLLVQREVPINDPINKILGHVDLEVTNLLPDLKEILCVEVKTINSTGFTKLTEPKVEHKKQLHAYMKSRKRKNGIVIYLEKDRAAVKEFLVPFDEKFYQKEVLGYIDQHFSDIATKTLPDRAVNNPNLYPCRFCSLTHVCFDSEALAKFLAPIQTTFKAPMPKFKLKLRK